MARKKKSVVQEESKSLWLLIVIIVTLILVFTLLKMGMLGIILNNLFTFLFGSFYVFPLVTLFGYGIYKIFFSSTIETSVRFIIGLFVLNISLILFSGYLEGTVEEFAILGNYIKTNAIYVVNGQHMPFNGGIIGNFLYALFFILISKNGVLILLITLFLISVVLLVPSGTFTALFLDLKNSIEESRREKQKEKERIQRELERKEELRKLKLAEKLNAQLELEQKQKENTLSRIDIRADDTPIKHEEVKEEIKEEVKGIEEPKILQVQRTHTSYRLPKPVDEYLEKNTSKASSINKTSAQVKGEKVIEILKNFGIEATLLNTYIGPSVTKFEIKPEGTVKINKILTISDNLKMELAAKDIRIEAPIPGRSAVGIEIPNVEPVPVKMIDLMKKVDTNYANKKLSFALGKDLMGKSVFCDLARMPHLLIAGATGSGKSVCINTIITSYLLRTNPDDVKLVLVDPKKVEFTPYKEIPHLLWPIIDDSTMASNMLKRIVVLMEERYDAFAECGVRNIESFNNFVAEHNANLSEGESKMNPLPYIVVIIDELADLMMIAGKEVELSIQRITQLARASGIHLIVATQRPSTDVITGLIKSNIPSRISFAVASSIDSRTILDTTGAERLLGNGDMLYYPQGETAPIRLQGVYVTDKEIKKITDYVKSQAKPEYEDSYFEFLTNMNGTTVMQAGQAGADSQDSLYDEVVEFVVAQQKASTSLLQRRFGIGYNRAARLIDTLEDRGVIGPANGSKPREVYRKDEE